MRCAHGLSPYLLDLGHPWTKRDRTNHRVIGMDDVNSQAFGLADLYIRGRRHETEAAAKLFSFARHNSPTAEES